MRTTFRMPQRVQWRLPLIRILLLLIALSIIGFVPATKPKPLAAQGGFQWYKVDTHVHSVISSDAPTDIGIMSQTGKDNGYDALFLTDHNGASSFHINNLTANYMAFEDAYTRWELGTFGGLSSSTNVLSTAQVNTGSRSLNLKSTSTSYGETFVSVTRGPNFRSGDIILKVSIFPVRVDPNSGAYVSVSIGGDPSIGKTPVGYTTESGVISPGKSVVLVWQIGSPRVASTNTNERVIVNTLSYNLNTWNHYTINVSDVLEAGLPAMDRPLDYNGLTDLKLAVAANQGTAEAYFDTYSIQASTPVAPADEFVYRTSRISEFDTATFKVFPSYEAGQQKHTQRFNFGITTAGEYRSYLFGTDSIPETHQSGYPAQLNHPGTTISAAEAVNTQAHGADVLETREDGWGDTWDDILLQDVSLVSSWSSDTHTGLSPGKSATYLYASAFTFDALMKAHFEGRSYNARNHFSGRVLFNLGSSATEPFPARYPVYVSDTPGGINVALTINDGVDRSWTIHWIRNGQTIASDKPSGTSYQATKSIALNGSPAYVRAEARKSSGSLYAATQAILFRPVASLPAGRSIYVYDVTNNTTNGYNNESVKGITSASWGPIAQLLQVLLENPVNSLVTLRMATEVAPMRVRVGSEIVAAATSLANFHAATGSSWFYESTPRLLHLKVRHANASEQLNVEFGSGGDTTPPSVPTGVSATALSISQVSLSWSASTDNLGVAGYIIYRDGVELASVDANTLNYVDNGLQPETTYSYRVAAVDTSNNLSEQSAAVVVTTPNVSTIEFNPVADSYVASDRPTSNFGRATTIRVDALPDTRSYLRFNLSGLTGHIQQATLRIYANTGSNTGYRIHGVDDTTWTESGLNYENAPAFGGVVGTSGLVGAGSWTSVDVTSLVSGDGLLSVGVSTTSNTAMSFASREDVARQPELLITISSDGEEPPPPPSDTYTFNAVADAYVGEDKATSNFGRAISLRTDASPIYRSYLRFTIENLVGVVEQATLRIYANSGSSIGYQVQIGTDSNWTETGITFSNAPAPGSVVGVSGSISPGTWTSVDVTSLVAGNGAIEIVLSSTSSTAINLGSREDVGHVPELVVETSEGVVTAMVGAGLDIATFDSWRAENGLDPDDNIRDSSALADPDGDGLTNLNEFANGTNPLLADSDNDTLPDQWEVENGVNPTDGTGNNGPDGDANGDGVTNAAEYALHSQPSPADADRDGLPDEWEQAHNLDPASKSETNGAGGDPDGDGLENINEWLNHSNPHHADSDDDSLPDLWEVESGLSPSNGTSNDGASGDPDGDGILNGDEHLTDNDPRNNDRQTIDGGSFFLPFVVND